MTEEQFEKYKAYLVDSTARERTPAARYARRLAYEHMRGVTGPLPPRPADDRIPGVLDAPEPRTERERLLAAGFVYSVRQQDDEAAASEHRARRRLAEQETSQRENVWRRLRDLDGPDEADQWFGGDAA